MTTQYTYAGDGVRLAQTVNGVSTRYVNDLAAALPQVLRESAPGRSSTYLYGLGLIGQQDSGLWAYHQPDGLGSVRQLVDGSGQVLLAQRYDPFGNLLERAAQPGQPASSFGFAGEQQDAAAGLTYLRARYYDPSVGRFLTRDPYPAYAGVPGTLHRYAYAHNDPVNLIDPSGLRPPPTRGQACRAAGGPRLGPMPRTTTAP